MINVLANNMVYTSLGVAMAVIFFLLTIVFSLSNYRTKQGRNYSFLNEFPYELSQGVEQRFVIYLYFSQMMQALGFVLFGFYAFVDLAHYFGIILIVSWTLTALLGASIFFVKLRSMKGHIAIVACLITFTLVNAVFLGIYIFKTIYLDAPLILPIICWILAAIVAFLAINPALKRWPFMDKIEQQDGTIIILRPKFFVLAYTEWAIIFINMLLLLVGFIAYFFI